MRHEKPGCPVDGKLIGTLHNTEPLTFAYSDDCLAGLIRNPVKFANDLPKLNEVRQSLRARMSAAEWAPANITRHLEAAYREMWRKWCRRT